MNYTASGVPSSYQGVELSQYETAGNPWHNQYHLPQISKMIQDSINNNVPQMIRDEAQPMIERACREMARTMIGAITYDIRTCVDLSFDDADDIFHSEKARKFVSDTIVRRIEARLKEYDFSIDL